MNEESQPRSETQVKVLVAFGSLAGLALTLWIILGRIGDPKLASAAF